MLKLSFVVFVLVVQSCVAFGPVRWVRNASCRTKVMTAAGAVLGTSGIVYFTRLNNGTGPVALPAEPPSPPTPSDTYQSPYTDATFPWEKFRRFGGKSREEILEVLRSEGIKIFVAESRDKNSGIPLAVQYEFEKIFKDAAAMANGEGVGAGWTGVLDGIHMHKSHFVAEDKIPEVVKAYVGDEYFILISKNSDRNHLLHEYAHNVFERQRPRSTDPFVRMIYDREINFYVREKQLLQTIADAETKYELAEKKGDRLEQARLLNTLAPNEAEFTITKACHELFTILQEMEALSSELHLDNPNQLPEKTLRIRLSYLIKVIKALDGYIEKVAHYIRQASGNFEFYDGGSLMAVRSVESLLYRMRILRKKSVTFIDQPHLARFIKKN